jgi:hypothetical protein
VHYEQNFIYHFPNYKSTGMNITNYVVVVFKYEIITDIQCSLKTALYAVLINETLGIVFSSLTCQYQH